EGERSPVPLSWTSPDPSAAISPHATEGSAKSATSSIVFIARLAGASRVPCRKGLVFAIRARERGGRGAGVAHDGAHRRPLALGRSQERAHPRLELAGDLPSAL